MANSDPSRRRRVTLLLACVVALSVIVSAALAAPPADRGRQGPSAQASTAENNPAKKCKAERASMGVQAFGTRYGTNANERNAFGKCASQNAKNKEKPAKR
jgi:hypothetical protein